MTTPIASAGRGGVEWRKARAAVLARDRYLCQLRLPGCLSTATAADHWFVTRHACLEAGWHGTARCRCNDVANLRAACAPCNTRSSNASRAGHPVEAEVFSEAW